MGGRSPAKYNLGVFPYNDRGLWRFCPVFLRKEQIHSNTVMYDPKQARAGLEVAFLTDVGRQRSNNEDSFLYWEPESEEDFRRLGRLAVIADGMGGYEGGQEASRLAVETVLSTYSGAAVSNPQTILLAALGAAHEKIQHYAAEHPELQGMGTTCTALALVGHQLCFAHVGDSRLYQDHAGTLTRLTRDHSYVGRLVESGIVRSEDAESHPQRHILTAALGSGRELTPDSPAEPIVLTPGDTLILCTDGLWSLTSEHELAGVVRSNPPSAACRILIQTALDRGGPDNITVLVLRVAS